ncbi:unnamed protein product, partial [marine sediment metagenome]
IRIFGMQKGSEIHSLPQTEEELMEHTDAVHHMPVIRPGETEEEMEATQTDGGSNQSEQLSRVV